MSHRNTCPDPRLWQNLLEDSCSAVEAESLNTHLESCPHCQELLEQVAVGRSGWLRQTPSSAAGDTGHALELSHMIDRLKKNLALEREGARQVTEELCLSFLSPAEKPDQLGKLGIYEVLEIIGRGGMGVVLKAFDPSLHRLVAIKVLSSREAGSGTARQRFLREGRAAAAVSHDHVITIHAVDEVNGVPFLVMEYVPGRSLQEKLDSEGPVPVPEILRIGMQTAEGLAAAHRQGLVHRDIKPGNILLANGVERVKLTDFGLARTLDDVGLTQSGTSPGTPLYMAPEQAQGEPIDQRTDLFSLGSVLYAMCTGQPPFRAGTVMAVLRKIREESPRSIRAQNPDIPSWLEEIIFRLLEKGPAARFATASEVGEVLGQALVRLHQPRPQDTPPIRPQLPRPSRKHWGWVAGVLVLIGGLIAAEATGLSELRQWAVTILRLRTEKGTLVVEIDDPQVKVALDTDRDELAITGVGAHEVRLQAGKYRLRTTKAGEQVHEEIVTITRGGKQIVRVSREAPADQQPRAGDVAANAGKFQPRYLAGHKGPVNAVSIAPDGKRAMSAGGWPHGDQTLRLWDLESGKEVARIDVLAAFSRRPRQGALGPREQLGDVFALDWAPDGNRCVAALAGGDLVLFDWRGGKPALLAGHTGTVYAARFCPDGKVIASTGRDGTLALWDVATGQLKQRQPAHANWGRGVAFAPDGQTVWSCGRDSQVIQWDVAGGRRLNSFELKRGWLETMAMHPSGKRLFVGGEHLLSVDLATGQVVHVAGADATGVTTVTVTRDGRKAATTSYDSTVRLWNLEQGSSVMLDRRASWAWGVDFSPDGTWLLSGGGGSGPGNPPPPDFRLRLWDLHALRR